VVDGVDKNRRKAIFMVRVHNVCGKVVVIRVLTILPLTSKREVGDGR